MCVVPAGALPGGKGPGLGTLFWKLCASLPPGCGIACAQELRPGRFQEREVFAVLAQQGLGTCEEHESGCHWVGREAVLAVEVVS